MYGTKPAPDTPAPVLLFESKLCATSGKPSTRLPLGGLVEQVSITSLTCRVFDKCLKTVFVVMITPSIISKQSTSNGRDNNNDDENNNDDNNKSNNNKNNRNNNNNNDGDNDHQ